MWDVCKRKTYFSFRCHLVDLEICLENVLEMTEASMLLSWIQMCRGGRGFLPAAGFQLPQLFTLLFSPHQRLGR